jgi:site-specific DNA-methyltransferase (adenine-specific)
MHRKERNEADLAGGLINTTLRTTPKLTGGIFDKPETEVERTGGTWAAKYGTKTRHWDIAPNEDYFNELFRVSQNQIIWGGNYFALPPTRCFLVWRKLTISESFSMAMCEYAWTSFNDNAKWIEIAPQGTADEKRFHPTQKPVKLYEWLLAKYAKKGDKILDTHVGSASSLIACHNYKFDYICFEIDKDCYEAATRRLEAVKAQMSLFEASHD